jgi:oligoribonuclease
MLAWIDCETTGLEPERDFLLEVALVITDDKLEEVAHRTELIRPMTRLTENMMDPVVWDMHTANGLIRELNHGAGMNMIQVEDVLIELVRDVLGKEKVPLCGSTISFDRAWLRSWMVDLDNAFHYRSIDVSSIKETARRFAPGVQAEWEECNAANAKRHRALDDIRLSIEEYRWYVSSMRNSMWMHPNEVEL